MTASFGFQLTRPVAFTLTVTDHERHGRTDVYRVPADVEAVFAVAIGRKVVLEARPVNAPARVLGDAYTVMHTFTRDGLEGERLLDLRLVVDTLADPAEWGGETPYDYVAPLAD